jgi:signal transduction histidine kinase
MSTVRAGPPQFQAVDLRALLNESVELFVKGLPPSGRGISVQAEIETAPPPVRADAGRIMQVLMDLLSNAHQAIATTRQHGNIRLRAEAVDQDGCCWVKVDVSDDGPGIPEVYLDRIFEPFFTTKQGGTGYGLYLASEILREQGGRLTACNNPAGGACLSIWLPREIDHDRPTRTEDPAPSTSVAVPGTSLGTLGR